MTADKVQALFNRIAPVYDQLNNSLSFGQHLVWKRMAVKWSGAKLGDTSLDLCCGSGDIAQILVEKVGRTGQVYGADFSVRQLDVARDRSERRCLKPAIRWVEADALNLPFSDNQFDCATMGYGLRNVTDIPLSLKELHRVLKPGANAAILDMHRPDGAWMRVFQQWYLDEVVVPMAQRLGFIEEYAYIAPSLDKFPIGSEQIKLAHQAGFSRATHYAIAGGTMGVLVVQKG
ncbi:bifunctional demethylmenaquinone methyltransferase/2-methoxy-6-polyprenyl-1,4-benzoquinol methylase UbiE [Myxacorys almedinensis]|uniref:2-phytyl-1,4-naphtoquinone methyltransferase n=1 Tax=Myxacorys almedinensis A TaxID=2690445 RepID=A0A8J7Z7I5_9CYAN|nr:bifunctional demethylmenaquinone methyltransferase/2-methoxy-6-polyprenyl-1,4-benzoquinol methylase UbiE [Myxacorys almedinensis]NDJ17833.1 bifunctional demethylmenaquinone methyltransferase/2-methoxy-6-polyprenyl-1,4-benzoquinol methylase UbiE [Myxacorys almedinensis A]